MYISPEGDYPLYTLDVKLADPTWSEGEDLPQGWNVVHDSPLPEFAEDEIIEDGRPVEIDGKFYRSFNIKKKITLPSSSTSIEKVVEKFNASGLTEPNLIRRLEFLDLVKLKEELDLAEISNIEFLHLLKSFKYEPSEFQVNLITELT